MISKAFAPERRITPIAPSPDGVLSATIVSWKIIGHEGNFTIHNTFVPMSQRWCFYAILFVFTVSCRKDKTIVDFDVFELPVSGKVRCIEAFGDSLVLAGGDVSGQGFLLVADATLSHFEVCTSTLKNEVYDVKLFDDRWYIGLDSVDLVTSKDLRHFQTYWWNQVDWVGDLYKHPLRRIEHVNAELFMVAGGKLAFGVAYHSSDSGQSWNPAEYDNEIRSLAAFGDVNHYSAWVGGDGILLKTTKSNPTWKRIELDNVFAADINFLNHVEGVLVTYEGDLYKSNDGGENWSRIQKSKKLRAVNRLLRINEELIILANTGQLAYSANNGQTLQWFDLEDVGDLIDGYWSGDRLILTSSESSIIQLSVSDLR
ncbi:MAG: YCF48-related protein [Flavobacteriales bacterium]